MPPTSPVGRVSQQGVPGGASTWEVAAAAGPSGGGLVGPCRSCSGMPAPVPMPPLAMAYSYRTGVTCAVMRSPVHWVAGRTPHGASSAVRYPAFSSPRDVLPRRIAGAVPMPESGPDSSGTGLRVQALTARRSDVASGDARWTTRSTESRAPTSRPRGAGVPSRRSHPPASARRSGCAATDARWDDGFRFVLRYVAFRHWRPRSTPLARVLASSAGASRFIGAGREHPRAVGSPTWLPRRS